MISIDSEITDNIIRKVFFLKWEILTLTKNLVTFKKWDEINDEKYFSIMGVHLKI